MDFANYDKKLRNAVNDEIPEVYEQFREEALKEVGLWGQPKADRAYSLAWDHAYGFEEAFLRLSDLANLFDERTV